MTGYKDIRIKRKQRLLKLKFIVLYGKHILFVLYMQR